MSEHLTEWRKLLDRAAELIGWLPDASIAGRKAWCEDYDTWKRTIPAGTVPIGESVVLYPGLTGDPPRRYKVDIHNGRLVVYDDDSDSGIVVPLFDTIEHRDANDRSVEKAAARNAAMRKKYEDDAKRERLMVDRAARKFTEAGVLPADWRSMPIDELTAALDRAEAARKPRKDDDHG